MSNSIEKFYIILNSIQSHHLRCESLSLTYIGEDDLELCFAEGTPLETKIDGDIPEVIEKFQQLLSIPNLAVGALDFYLDEVQARRYEPHRAKLIMNILRVISNQQTCRNIDWLTIDSKNPVEVLQIAGLLNRSLQNLTMITIEDPDHPTPIEFFQHISKSKVQNVRLEDLQPLLKHFMRNASFQNCEIRYDLLTKKEIREGFDKERKQWPIEGGDLILCPGILSPGSNHKVGIHFEDGKITFFKQFP